jgi:hypothetical protein
MTPTTGVLWDRAQFDSALFGGTSGAPGPIIHVGQGLLYPALRKAGVTLGPQRTPSPAQLQDAIEEVNRLIGSLNCDPYWIYGQEIVTFPLNAGQKIYTIGIDPTGAFATTDFPIPAPKAITQAVYVQTLGPPPLRYPLGILTPQMWAGIRLQDIPNTIPQGIYYDRGYPIGRIYIYGQPPAGGQLELYIWHLIPMVASAGDVVVLPQGYEDAIVLNLACRLGPHFQRQVDQDVRDQARLSLMRLESQNAPQPVLNVGGIGCGCGGGGTSDPWSTTTWGPQK